MKKKSAITAKQIHAMRMVLSARCNLMGWPPTEENMRTVRAEWYGCEAGRALLDGRTMDPDLWDAVKHIRRVTMRYLSALEAPRPFPAGMMAEVAPEHMATAEDIMPRGEELTDEERVRRATAAFMDLEGALGMAGLGAASEVRRVAVEDASPRDVRLFRAAVRMVADNLREGTKRH